MTTASLRQSSVRSGPRPLAWAVALALGTALLAGCGTKDADKPATQTAAKVNGDEITVHQINAELQRASLPQGADADAVSKRILDNLIDQEILVQQATEMKLNRDPQVMQRVEAARRQVLAQAYLERVAAGSPPSADEIKAFYEKNPDLFSNRKVYAFRDFVFERSALTDALRERLDKAKAPADVEAALKEANVRFRQGNSVRAAEQLPLEALPRIAKIDKGDIIVFNDQNLATAMLLLDSRPQPVDLQRATPLITRFIVNSRRREAAQAKMKELREKAKIEYVGKFAKAEEPATAGQPATAAPAQAGAPAAAPAAGAKPTDDHIQKGLSGLR